MSDSWPQASSIRVLLVDDNPMLRQALRSALEAHANIEVAGEASDGEQALVCVAKLQPTAVVMDINLPKIDGITATRLTTLSEDCRDWTHARAEGLHVIFHEKSGSLRSGGQEERCGGIV
jgi:DNA-binding NarL/FixJ family response regulator